MVVSLCYTNKNWRFLNMEKFLYILLIVINTAVILFFLFAHPLSAYIVSILLAIYLISLVKQKYFFVVFSILCIFFLSAYSLLYAVMIYLFSSPPDGNVGIGSTILSICFLGHAILNPSLSIMLFIRKVRTNSKQKQI